MSFQGSLARYYGALYIGPRVLEPMLYAWNTNNWIESRTLFEGSYLPHIHQLAVF